MEAQHAIERTTTPVKPQTMASEGWYIISMHNSTVYALNGKTGRTDYSGTDAASVINRAITAVASTGGEVEIREGTYILTSSVVIDGDNIVLRGVGDATVLTVAPNAKINALEATGRTHIVVANLLIDGNKAHNNESYNGFLQCGIYFEDVAFGTVTGVRIHDNFYHGVMIVGESSVIVVSGNTIVGNGDSGIEVHWKESKRNRNIEIRDNVVAGNPYGIYVSSADNIRVEGNIVRDAGTAGIVVTDGAYTPNTPSRGVNIVGNVVDGYSTNGVRSDAAGIVLWGAHNTTVTNNEVLNGANYGIITSVETGHKLLPRFNTITGNLVRNNSRHGIIIMVGTDQTIDGNALIDNCQSENDTYSDIMLMGDSSLGWIARTAVSRNVIIARSNSICRYGIRDNSPYNQENVVRGNIVIGQSIPIILLGNDTSSDNITEAPASYIEAAADSSQRAITYLADGCLFRRDGILSHEDPD
jgi:parallel beta-helix repeat protein